MYRADGIAVPPRLERFLTQVRDWPAFFSLGHTKAGSGLERVVKMKQYAEEWNRLYKQALVEQDPQKVQRLIEEIFRFLEKRLSSSASPKHADFRSAQSRLLRDGLAPGEMQGH